MSTSLTINADRLIRRIQDLGQIGRDANGVLTRLAASDADKEARDALVSWMKSIDLDVRIDCVGNVFGIWQRRSIAASRDDGLPHRHRD